MLGILEACPDGSRYGVVQRFIITGHGSSLYVLQVLKVQGTSKVQPAVLQGNVAKRSPIDDLR